MLAAREKAGGDDAVMIGDTPWDIEAARKAGVQTICVITGGFSRQELEEAGAAAVFESVEEPSTSPRYPLLSSAVAVAQLVEPRVVVPVVGGSSPLRHPSR